MKAKMFINGGFLFATLFAIVPMVVSANTVYRPGLVQVLFEKGSANGFATGVSGVPVLASNLVETAKSDSFARGPELVPYPLMDKDNNVANPVTGTTWSWPNDYATFAYEGEIYVTAGTTYTFYGRFDDGSALVIDGSLVLLQREESGYNKQPQVWGDWTAPKTGWVPFNGWIWDWTGGKATKDCSFALQWNSDGVKDSFTDSAKWHRFIDPGDMSFLRARCSEHFTSVVGVEAAANGTDLVLSIAFSNLPSPAAVTAYYGTADGGMTPAAWGDSVSFGTVPVDTIATNWVLVGAADASVLRLYVEGQTGVATYFTEWTEAAALSSDPVLEIEAVDAFYTNATISVNLSGFGVGAVEDTLAIQLATSADGFDNPIAEFPFQSNPITAPGLYDASVSGLMTNATYYVRAVVSSDNGGKGFSNVVSFQTLLPGAPSGFASYLSSGFTTLSFMGAVTDWGADSSSADMTLELSTSDDFPVDSTLSFPASETAAGSLPSTQTLIATGLTGNTAYHARLRIVNTWGLVTVIPIDGTRSTYAIPITATGIGYVFSADGSTVDFTFGVSGVFDGATGTATLEYDGRTVSSQTFFAPGMLSWAGVTASVAAATATVTVTATVGGTTYTRAWTSVVTPGTAAHAVSSLSDLSGMFFRVGDSVTLPELPGDDHYVVMDIRSFLLGEDGVTLTALEPGFSAVVSLAWDGVTSAFAVADRALAVCIPKVAGSGCVFFAKPGAKMNWEDASKWTNVTDPSAAADYPHRTDDVAMVALPDNQLVLNADASVAELYLGPDEDHMHAGGTQRLTGKNAATLTFARSSGKPGFLRFTGMSRIDTPALTSGINRFAIGGGDGNSTSTGLGIEMPGGLEFDCGAWPDWTNTTLRSSFGRARYWISDSMRHWNIPAGRTLRISNTNGRKQEGDSQDGYANFCWESGSQVTGEGTFFYDAAASLLSKGMFRSFGGVVKVANKQAYDTFNPSDRGGGFKFRPESYTSSSGKVAEDATLLLEGDAKGSDVGSSFGVVNAGHTHGYGSWGRAINAYPAKKWILDGGYVFQTHVGSTDVSWREDGTDATRPVCIPNGAETLCVSNGFNYVKLSQSGDANAPTNSLVFASLEYAGDGVLVVNSDRLFYSFSNNGAGANWRVRTVLGGFHDLAIGGTGRAIVRHGAENVRTNYLEATAPIVPWIVASVEADSNLYFPGADDDTDELVLAGHLGNTVLDQASDPTANVRVNGTTVALSADRTVNSLVLVNNRNAGKNLGAGRTLTITSGGLVMGNGNYKNTAYLGDESGYNAGTAGTLVFPNKAYVFVPVIRDDKNEHPEIWAKIVSTKGVVFSYPGDMHIGGDQTGIDDHIAVNGTDLRLGTATTGCLIDVPVHLHGAFAKLRIGKQGSFCRQDLYFWDHLTTGSKFEAAAGTEEVVHKLYVNGMNMPRGTYGATGSGAKFIDDNHFSGSGWIRVLKDDLAVPLVIRLK